MPVTIQLPRPLEEQLTQEAQREGVSATEYATLLLYLAHTFVSEGRPTPFREAVRVFLSRHSLDADHVASALEELVRLCLAEEKSDRSSSLQKALGQRAPGDLTLLTQWRNALVHSVGAGPEASSPPRVLPHQEERADEENSRDPERDPALVARVKSIRGSFADHGAGLASEELQRERQADKEREERLVQESGA
jgi:hypothetical protein